MLKINIMEAAMTYTKEDGYVGKVYFGVEGHDNEYEITLHRKRGNKTWGYGLFFLNKSGDEDQLLALEDELEEDDELFDTIVEAATSKLEQYDEE